MPEYSSTAAIRKRLRHAITATALVAGLAACASGPANHASLGSLAGLSLKDSVRRPAVKPAAITPAPRQKEECAGGIRSERLDCKQFFREGGRP